MSKRADRLAGAALLFAALGDPTRLALLNRLSASESRIGDDPGRCVSTRRGQGISKHLQVLAAAGVIDGTRVGREQVWTLNPRQLVEARRHMNLIARGWDSALSPAEGPRRAGLRARRSGGHHGHDAADEGSGDEDRDAHPQAGGGGVRGVHRPGHHDESSGSRRAVGDSRSGARFGGRGRCTASTSPVTVIAVEPDARLVIEWPGQAGPTTVEWTFAAQPDRTTFVRITNSGFAGDGDALVRQVTDSTQGFSLVLAGLKALLEHGIRLNLVADRYPPGIEARRDPRSRSAACCTARCNIGGRPSHGVSNVAIRSGHALRLRRRRRLPGSGRRPVAGRRPAAAQRPGAEAGRSPARRARPSRSSTSRSTSSRSPRACRTRGAWRFCPTAGCSSPSGRAGCGW